MSEPSSPPAVSLRSIRKSFGEVRALQGVDFELAPGEIHALLGENGAGKTTLMNILYGLARPDSGEMRLAGKPVTLTSPRHAIAAGIGMVHQHFMLAPSLTVAENLFLGARMPGMRGPWFSRRRAFVEARSAAERFRVQIDVEAPVETLSVGERQRVELLKALCRGARVLILDEPTAVLAPEEVDDLFTSMEAMRADGRSIVFISHKLREVTRICDRITVLRGGKSVATLPAREAQPEELGAMMVGRELDVAGVAETNESSGPVMLEATIRMNLPRFGEARIVVCGGEIYGIVGVEGNGQDELVGILSGTLRAPGALTRLQGEDMSRLGPAARAEKGLGVIAGDRSREGLIPDFSIAENLLLKSYRQGPFARWGWMPWRSKRDFARAMIRRHAIRAPGPWTRAAQLSGGNQQKVVVARELALMRGALVAVNPTRGLDIAAARAVHDRLLEARRNGAAIALITNELDEALALSDRIGVLYRGRLHEAGARPFDRAAIGRLMLGATIDAAQA